MNIIDTGKLIRQARKEKGMTQVTLSEILHVGNNTICNWEKGRCMPDKEYMLLLCQTLGILPMELLTGKKLENEGLRRELLQIMSKEDGERIRYADEQGEETEIDLSEYMVVTLDAQGELSDLWIPYNEMGQYTQDEIFEMQDRLHEKQAGLPQ